MSINPMSANEFIQLRKVQELTVLDLRTPAEVKAEKLEGCEFIPVQDLTSENFADIADKAKNDKVYLLCQSGKRAVMALAKIDSKFHDQCIVLEGGLNAIKHAHTAKKDSGSSTTEIKTSGKLPMSLERQVRIAAGLLVVTGIVLSVFVASPFYWLSAVVGAGLVFAGVTDTCGMGMFLARMPWNK